MDRKIYFYRANVGRKESGKLQHFNAPDIFHQVKQRINAQENQIYMRMKGAPHLISCHVEESAGPVKICLGKIRREGLPRQEQDGIVTDLPIPLDAGLIEESHIIFFPNNIVGFEFNFYGPRISSMRRFLRYLFPDNELLKKLTFDHLLRDDPARRLSELEGLRLFRMRIDRSFADRIAQADESLAQAFKCSFEAADSEEVEIVLRSAPRSKSTLSSKLIDTIKQIFKMEGIYENVRTLKVEGPDNQTGRMKPIDLLEDKLVTSRAVVQLDGRTRAVLSNSVYDAILEAESELHNDLKNAPGIY